MKPFTELTYTGQIRRLRQLALHALAAYTIGDARLVTLTNTENMTFRVECANGERYIMRIHRPAAKSVELIRSELLWLAALRRDTDLQVPDPLPANDRALVVMGEASGVPGPRPCVLFRWMDGEFAGDELGAAHLRQVGSCMARLHEHAEQFVPPVGFTRGRLAVESFANDAIPASLRAPGPLITQQDVEVVATAYEQIHIALTALGEQPDIFGLIHADLHQWNYLFHQGEVRVIDFDDCCWSYYLYDMAVTLRMVRQREDFADLRAAFLEGYRRIRPLSSDYEALIDLFMLIRGLLLTGWLVTQLHNPELNGWAQTFVPESLDALRAFVGRQ